MIDDAEAGKRLSAALVDMGLLVKGQPAPVRYASSTGQAKVSLVWFLVLPRPHGGELSLVAKFDEADRAAREWKAITELRKLNAPLHAFLPMAGNEERHGTIIYQNTGAHSATGKVLTLAGFLRRQLAKNPGNCLKALEQAWVHLRKFYLAEPGAARLSADGEVLKWGSIYGLTRKMTGIRKGAILAWPDVDWDQAEFQVPELPGRTFPNPLHGLETRLGEFVGRTVLSRIHGDLNLDNLMVGLTGDHMPESVFIIDLASSRAPTPTVIDLARMESEFWHEVFTPLGQADTGGGLSLVSGFAAIRDTLDGGDGIDSLPREPLFQNAVRWVDAIRREAVDRLGGGLPNYRLEDYMRALHFTQLRALDFETVQADPAKCRTALLGSALTFRFLNELESGGNTRAPVLPADHEMPPETNQRTRIPDVTRVDSKENAAGTKLRTDPSHTVEQATRQFDTGQPNSSEIGPKPKTTMKSPGDYLQKNLGHGLPTPLHVVMCRIVFKGNEDALRIGGAHEALWTLATGLFGRWEADIFSCHPCVQGLFVTITDAASAVEFSEALLVEAGKIGVRLAIGLGSDGHLEWMEDMGPKTLIGSPVNLAARMAALPGSESHIFAHPNLLKHLRVRESELHDRFGAVASEELKGTQYPFHALKRPEVQVSGDTPKTAVKPQQSVVLGFDLCGFSGKRPDDAASALAQLRRELIKNFHTTFHAGGLAAAGAYYLPGGDGGSFCFPNIKVASAWRFLSYLVSTASSFGLQVRGAFHRGPVCLIHGCIPVGPPFRACETGFKFAAANEIAIEKEYWNDVVSQREQQLWTLKAAPTAEAAGFTVLQSPATQPPSLGPAAAEQASTVVALQPSSAENVQAAWEEVEKFLNSNHDFAVWLWGVNAITPNPVRTFADLRRIGAGDFLLALKRVLSPQTQGLRTRFDQLWSFLLLLAPLAVEPAWIEEARTELGKQFKIIRISIGTLPMGAWLGLSAARGKPAKFEIVKSKFDSRPVINDPQLVGTVPPEPSSPTVNGRLGQMKANIRDSMPGILRPVEADEKPAILALYAKNIAEDGVPFHAPLEWNLTEADLRDHFPELWQHVVFFKIDSSQTVIPISAEVAMAIGKIAWLKPQ